MPARSTPWDDEFTLLCERCGYVLEGLPADNPCPECGKPIAESLPERRTGTPWQRDPSWRSLLATWWMTLRHPLRTLDMLRPDHAKAKSLARWTCAVGLPLWGVLLALTWIETRGLLLFGKQHHARVTPAIAWTICAHGCVGWVVSIGTVLASAAIVLVTWMVDRTWIDFGEYRTPAFSNVGWAALGIAGYLLPAGILAGFLFFETFAWLGLRRCRFANHIRPNQTAPANPSPAS